jgi:hypothetical protein
MISISKAFEGLQNQVKALQQPALLQQQDTCNEPCPPKCTMHHTLCAHINLCVHAAMSKNKTNATSPSCIHGCCVHIQYARTYSTIADLCCVMLPCPAAVYVRHHLLFRCRLLLTRCVLGWFYMFWWIISMQWRPVAHARTCCTLFSRTTCFNHGRGLLVVSLESIAAAYTGKAAGTSAA